MTVFSEAWGLAHSGVDGAALLILFGKTGPSRVSAGRGGGGADGKSRETPRTPKRPASAPAPAPTVPRVVWEAVGVAGAEGRAGAAHPAPPPMPWAAGPGTAALSALGSAVRRGGCGRPPAEAAPWGQRQHPAPAPARAPSGLRARGPHTAQLDALTLCAGRSALSSRLTDLGAAAGTADCICRVNPTCAHAHMCAHSHPHTRAHACHCPGKLPPTQRVTLSPGDTAEDLWGQSWVTGPPRPGPTALPAPQCGLWPW